MKILFVAAEVAPFAKVGGLADVAGSLPKALHALGHDVRVLMPSYRMVEEALGSGLGARGLSRGAAEHAELGGAKAGADENPHPQPLPPLRAQTIRQKGEGARFDVAINPHWVKKAYLNETILDLDHPPRGGVGGSTAHGVPVYMVGTDEWFTKTVSSETIYQPGADAYLFFAAAAMHVPEMVGWMPDVIHANDWHTGFLPVLMRERRREWESMGAVFTIHNLAYQGEFGFDVLDKLALPHYLFNMDQLEFYGSINFLKAGCVFSDQVNTVSPTYAQEIQGPEYGCHLEGLMAHLSRQKRLRGILNGIDDAVFNPSLDPHIAAHYDVDNLGGKAECRAELLSRLKMEPLAGAPLVGAVTRLSDQKGMNLFLGAADDIFSLGCQVVVQGLGDPWLADSFEALEKKWPRHFRFVNAFDVGLAQQVYAGCDAFLMPSLFEPCGLGQMIAMRYGTLPIVRSTGGLADTVREGVNGFTFEPKTHGALFGAMKRMHSAFGVSSSWLEMVSTAMRGDYSWAKSAREYVAMYERAIEQRKQFAKSA